MRAVHALRFIKLYLRITKQLLKLQQKVLYTLSNNKNARILSAFTMQDSSRALSSLEKKDKAPEKVKKTVTFPETPDSGKKTKSKHTRNASTLPRRRLMVEKTQVW